MYVWLEPLTGSVPTWEVEAELAAAPTAKEDSSGSHTQILSPCPGLWWEEELPLWHLLSVCSAEEAGIWRLISVHFALDMIALGLFIHISETRKH